MKSCTNDPELWFNPYSERLAQLICLNCPAIKACTEFAESTDCDPRWGVVAGMTARERMNARGIKSVDENPWKKKGGKRG